MQALSKLQEDVNALRNSETVDRIKQAAGAPPTKGAVANPPGDGKCAYTIAAWAQQLADDPNPANLKISAKIVQGMKELILENACKRQDELIAASESTNRSADQQETAGGKDTQQVVKEGLLVDLGESMEEFTTHVLEGKGRRSRVGKL